MDKQAIREEMKETKEDLVRKLALVEEKMGEAVEDVRRKFDPKTYICQHPVGAVSGAAAVGLVLGLGALKLSASGRLFGKLAFIAFGAFEEKIVDFAKKEIPGWAPHVSKAVHEVAGHFREPQTVEAVERHRPIQGAPI